MAAAAGLALGLALPRIDGGYQVASDRAVDVLKVVGLGVLSVTTLIFSLLFLVVQWAAGNFSHRLALFRSDPAVWRVFAFVVGLLVFAVTAILAIGSEPTVSVTVPTATLVLSGAALVLVRRLQLGALRSIQLAHVLIDVRDRGRKVLRTFYPPAGTAPRAAGEGDGPRRLPEVTSSVVWPHGAVVVGQVDLLRLVRVAASADAVIVLRVPVGATLHAGDVVAEVRGGRVPGDQVLRSVVAGVERTFHQDPMLAFRLLSDIGLRALSSAINDPATAVQVLDATEDLLRYLTSADLGARSIAGGDGSVRVVLCLPSWDEFIRVGIDDMLWAASNSPMVLSRVRALLSRLRNTAPEPCRRSIEERLEWIEREFTDKYPPFMRAGSRV